MGFFWGMNQGLPSKQGTVWVWHGLLFWTSTDSWQSVFLPNVHKSYAQQSTPGVLRKLRQATQQFLTIYSIFLLKKRKRCLPDSNLFGAFTILCDALKIIKKKKSFKLYPGARSTIGKPSSGSSGPGVCSSVKTSRSALHSAVTSEDSAGCWGCGKLQSPL